MSAPLIGITVNHLTKKNNDVEDWLLSAYPAAVMTAGGLPVMIPNEFPLDKIDLLIEKLDGLILTGGGDIQTSRFNGVESDTVGGVSRERDELELQLVRQALQADLPLLGICRGLQVLNVALGGTLFTDIPAQFPTTLQHNNLSTLRPRDFIAHQVTVLPGSRLSMILKLTQLDVNSRHHQAVKDVAEGMLVSARAVDGLIEALEIPGKRFVLGVQWHPENLQHSMQHRALFEALIQSAQV